MTPGPGGQRAPGQEISALEEAIGYRFRDPGLLLEALTHKSYHYEHPDDAPVHNERLEFLGDSVLGLSVVSYLFELGGENTEATMSKIKSYVVKRAVLSEIGNEIGLGAHLRIGKGEEGTGGRKKSSIVADAFEAVLGAIYLDAGYETAREAVLRLLAGKLRKAVDTGNYHDYKTDLQEYCQTHYGKLPEYHVTDQEGLDHEKTFTVEVCVNGRPAGLGRGRNKKEAQQDAARDAMEKLV
jgi:ribonuclease-3